MKILYHKSAVAELITINKLSGAELITINKLSGAELSHKQAVRC